MISHHLPPGLCPLQADGHPAIHRPQDPAANLAQPDDLPPAEKSTVRPPHKGTGHAA